MITEVNIKTPTEIRRYWIGDSDDSRRAKLLFQLLEELGFCVKKENQDEKVT